MRIKAIRFEPGTITPGTNPKRLDVVLPAIGVRLSDDTIGVWVNELRVPWHRVLSVEYETEAPTELSGGAGAVPQPLAQQHSKPPKRK